MSYMPRFNISANSAAKPIVIALHCSGASGAEWQQLERDLGSQFKLIAPDLIGSEGITHWNDPRTFKLSDEAARIVKIIDQTKQPVHLVGHSFGGCVALRVAIERPTQVASMTLYEPAAFYILATMGADGKRALEELCSVANDVDHFVSIGDRAAAARRFVDFWNSDGSWAALNDKLRDDLARYIPKASFEFSAAFFERISLYAYRRLYIPVLLLQGEHAPESTKLISRQLTKAIRFISPQTIAGAGHMGPFTHASVVSAMMAGWIKRVEQRVVANDPDVDSLLEQVA